VLSRLTVVLMLVATVVPASAEQRSDLDTSRIDAALGRSGMSVGGLHLVLFRRPDLRVMLEDVRLSTGFTLSFATFSGTDDHAEMMGEVCALDDEVTPVIAKLRSAGIDVTGIHNHFLGESPRLMFLHFMAHGRSVDLARAFSEAVATTATPMGPVPAPAEGPTPAWARAVQEALGWQGSYSVDDQQLEMDVANAHFPKGPSEDFWFAHAFFFQEAPGGKVAASGDFTVTAEEIAPVLSALIGQDFRIAGVHNHTSDENPRAFFVHFWKVSTPQDLGRGLKAALAVAKTRQ
jgi:hypothetical protein